MQGRCRGDIGRQGRCSGALLVLGRGVAGVHSHHARLLVILEGVAVQAADRHARIGAQLGELLARVPQLRVLGPGLGLGLGLAYSNPNPMGKG